jgi:hypothetical protein
VGQQKNQKETRCSKPKGKTRQSLACLKPVFDMLPEGRAALTSGRYFLGQSSLKPLFDSRWNWDNKRLRQCLGLKSVLKLLLLAEQHLALLTRLQMLLYILVFV